MIRLPQADVARERGSMDTRNSWFAPSGNLHNLHSSGQTQTLERFPTARRGVNTRNVAHVRATSNAPTQCADERWSGIDVFAATHDARGIRRASAGLILRAAPETARRAHDEFRPQNFFADSSRMHGSGGNSIPLASRVAWPRLRGHVRHMPTLDVGMAPKRQPSARTSMSEARCG
jgi:hypothetical protein